VQVTGRSRPDATVVIGAILGADEIRFRDRAAGGERLHHDAQNAN